MCAHAHRLGEGQTLITVRWGNKQGHWRPQKLITRNVSNHCLEFFQKLSGKPAPVSPKSLLWCRAFGLPQSQNVES